MSIYKLSAVAVGLEQLETRLDGAVAPYVGARSLNSLTFGWAILVISFRDLQCVTLRTLLRETPVRQSILRNSGVRFSVGCLSQRQEMLGFPNSRLHPRT